MIKHTDLRCGNLILRKDISFEPEKWRETTINLTYLKLICDFPEDYNPIPITEEWLVRCGFEGNPYQDRYENKVIHIEINKIRKPTELCIDRMPHIKYIHQLQNLYHALTGEELTITHK